MKKPITGLALTAAVAAAGLAFAAAPAKPVHAKTLVYCSEGDPSGFNPFLFTDGTTFDASSRQIYNRLVEFERGTTSIIPALAESWEVSEDGLTYTFSLRAGVKFHGNDSFAPSRGFNADDVLYTFERQLRDDHPFHTVSGGTYEYFTGMSMDSLIGEIERVDDLTVRFQLTRPEAPFIANLGMDFASVLSAEYADQMLEAGTPEQVDLAPIGTGPFTFVDFQPGATIRYKAFDDYWLGRSPLDNLVFAIGVTP